MDSKFKRLLSLVLALVMVISNVTIVRAEATAEPVQIVLGDKVDTIDSGKTYLIVNTRAGKTMTNRATENNNGLVMEGTTADITSATFWTIEGSDGAYTVKDPNGKYLDMVDGNASVQDIVDVVSIARNGSNWTISQNGAYLNDHGGSGTRAAGWNGGSASTDPGSQWDLYEVVTHKTVGLKVGQEMELTIEGVAHQSGNVEDSEIVSLESVKPVVTGSPLKLVKVGNANSFDGTKKYVFISERSITGGLLTTEPYDATISWSGLTISGLKTNGTVSAETEELWTIAPADGGKYAIKHGDKYLTLDHASSSTAGLVDEPCSLSLTRDGNYWYIQNADGDYLSNVGGFGNEYYGASGFNEKGGSGFSICEVAAISEYNTVVTIAGLAEGTTSLKVGSTVYNITVTCDHKRTEIRGAEQPTLFGEGYTGDLYCADCGTLMEKGTAISKLTAKNAKILSNNSIIALEDCMYVLIGETNGSRSLVHAGTYYVKPCANGNNVVHTTGQFAQLTLVTTWNGKAADDHSIRITGPDGKSAGQGYIHVWTAGEDKPYWDRCTDPHGPKDNGTDGLYLFYKNEDGSGNEIPGYTMVTNGNVQSGKSYLIAAKQGENTWYIMVPTVSTEKLDHIAQLVTDGVTHGHKYTTTTTATCVNAGVKTETCTCGHFHTSADDAMGHTFERDGGDTNAIKCGDCSVPNPNYKPVEIAPDVSFGAGEGETVTEAVKNEIVNAVQNNEAVNNYKPVEDHADVEELEITFTAVTFKEEENKHVPIVLVFEVTPKMNGEKVASPSDPITFRLPVPDSVAQAFAKVFHNNVQMSGLFEVKVENGNKYVEIESDNFSEFKVVFTDETPVVNHVAKIGEQGYATLQAAVDAANADDIITVIADVTEEIQIDKGQNLVIDLDGKTLNGCIKPFSGKLTVKNGTINNTNSAYSGIEINAGELVLENVNIASARHAVRIDGAVTATINGGKYTLIVTSGTHHAVNVSGAADVTINAGTFVGPKGTTMDSGSAVNIQSGAKVTIHGGTFSGGKNSTLGVSGTLLIDGGNFDQDPSAFVANTYCAEKNANGTYDVVKGIATIGDTYYGYLQSAIAAVKDGETIVLLDDVTVTTKAYGDNALNHARAVSFALDLNGKTLSANTGNSVLRFNITGSGATSDVTLTIKNGKVIAGSNTWCALMASGISADAKAVMNLENLTVEASKPGDLAVKSWANAVINAKNVTINATNGAGGFYAVGGEIVLDNCTVNQKGLHNEPYLSMAIAVSGGGKATVNSGTYSSVPTAAAEGNNQGTSHGSWVAGVMNSGGTLIINGGTFSNGNFGDDSLATAARGLIFADTKGIVEVNGGTFNALKSIFDFQNNLAGTSPVITVSGGTYSADPTDVTSYGSIKIAKGYDAVENADGTWTVQKIKVAEVNGVKYTSLEEAAAAAKSGDEIILLADVTEDVTVPAGVIFNGNGKQVGVITAAGEITFKGVTKATNFGTEYTNTTINIPAGACLEITGTGRLVIGHGCTFNITGTIENAKTADVAGITPSLIAPGASFTGAGVNFNVTNAYIKFTAYCSSKNSNASGTFNFNINNSIWEQTNVLAFYVPTNGMDPTVNFSLTDSVLNSTSHLVFAVTKGEVEFDNANVNVDAYRQLENRSTLTIKNGSVVYASVQTSSNAKNPGTTIVDNATYVTTGTFGGADVGTGKLILKNNASFTTGTFAKVDVALDKTSTVTVNNIDAATTTVELGAGASLTAAEGLTVTTVNDYKVVYANGVYTSVEKVYVAQISDKKFESVAKALAYAKAQNMTDVTITLIGETTASTTDSFDLAYTTAFDSVTFKQADATKTYYLYDLYTGSRTNGGKFIFDGVNLTVTDQYMFEGNVTLSNNSIVKSVAEANCFIYNGETTVEPGSKLYGVIENFRGGDLIVDGGKTDGTYNVEPDMQDAILVVNWSGDKLILKNGAYVKINAANEVGRLTLNDGTTLEMYASKLDAYQWIAVDSGATMNLDLNSVINTQKITGAGNIVINAANFNGEKQVIYADMSGFTGNVKVINNDLVFCEITANGIVVKQYVAQIGDQGYATVQAAVNAVQNGDIIVLLDDVTEDVTLTEKTGLYYTIDGNGNEMNGTITISSLSDTNDNRRITIKGINFVTETARDFITSTATNHYPRLTVEGCSFTGTGNGDTVAIRLKSSHSVVIKDCSATGLHSFLQNTSGWNLTVENVTVTNSKSGLALGTVQGVAVKGCNIDVNGYGIRMDAKYNNNAVISDNTVTAFIPVVVRKASVDSNITVSGTNNMTAENNDGVWFAIGTSEYEENGKLPTASTGKVVVKLDDAGLDRKGIYGQYAEAKIGDLKYTTLAEAVAAARAGDEIVLLADVTIAEGETIEINGFKLNAGNFKVTNNGTVNVCGNVTFVAPEMTGNAINGHNATLADSNIGVGYNLYGTENKITGNTTIKGITSLGYGYTTTEKVALNITGNFNGTNVLVRTGSGYDHELTVGDANGERTTVYFGQLGTFGDAHITNTDVTYGYAFIRNDLTLTNSSMTIKDGVNTYIAGNAKVVLDNSTWNMPGYANIGSYGGYMYGNADVTLKNGSRITATNLGIEVKDDNIVKVTLEDNSNLTATKLTNTGSIVLNGVEASVTSNECGNVISGLAEFDAGYVDGTYKLVGKPIAVIGENNEIISYHSTLGDAINAVAEGGTIKLLKDVVINESTRVHNSDTYYDGVYYIGDKSFTIDLGDFTVTHDGSVNDYLLNFKNDGSKANEITLKNGTIEAASSAYCAVCTSSGSTQQITVNLENVNVIGGNPKGSVIKVRGGTVLNVKAGTVITGKDSYLGIECVASTVNIYDGAEIYMNGTSSYNGCLVGACVNGTVNVYGGYGKGVKGGFIAMTSGGTINVSGGEWIANTDGTVGNNSNLYVLTAQNNSDESGYAGASIINVTGGTFRGGMDAWILNTGRNEVAELNISGGNFNVNPSAYIVEDHKVIENADGTFDVKQNVHLIINVGGSGISTMALREESVNANTMDEAVAIAQSTDAEKVTYKISGEVELTTGGSHGILNLGKNVTIEGVTPDAKLTIVGDGVPDIKGVTFKNLTLADEGTYLPTANEFMYQNYIDCSFENVTFVDGIRLSGKSTLTDCTVKANTTNEYAIWLDEGEFTMTGSTVTGGNDAYGLIKSDEVDKITITDNTFQYLGNANKEALNVKNAVIDAQDNTFIDCDKGILPADKINYAADGTTVLTETAVVGDNKVITNVAEVNGQKFETLDAAYAAAQNGGEVKILRAGTYKVPSGKNITITGMVDGVVFDNIGPHNMGGASVTFNNVTFDYYPNVNYTGLQHSGNLVYNNCTINGQVFLYGQSETFNSCTFNQNSADAYNVWTYSAKEVDFNNCTFNSAGKSVLIYAESAGITNAISVTNSTFNASAAVDGKAAIEIDTSLTAGATITIDAATTATGFGKGNVSGNSLWNNKKGNNTDANNDVTVKVGDQTVLAPVTFVAKIGEIGYTTLVDAFKAATEGCTIEILRDVTIDYKWDCRDYATNGSHSQFKESVTINGNGHTIEFTGNVNDGNWNTIFRFEEDATVKNLTVDISEATGAQRVISAKKSLSVDGLTIIGSAKRYGIIFGEGASDEELAAAEIEVKNSTLTGTRRAISDNEGGKDVKSVTVTGNTLNANVYVSANETVVFTDNKVNGAVVDIRSYTDLIDTVTVSGNTLTNGASGEVRKAASYDNIQDEFNIVATASVVSGGTVKYFNTLQAAIDAAQDGDVVNLLANSSEDVTVVQTPDKDIVIDGNGNTYSGTITIHGNARHDGAETLTIQNVKFETSEAGHYFIDSNSTGSVERYAHNVTVKNSSFTATGAAEHTAAAMRIRQGFNISMQNVVADGMHSMLQAYGNAGVTISGLNATNMKNGISAGTSTDVVIDNVKIEASGYGVRADGEGAYDLTVKNSEIVAEQPVVVRRNTASGYELTLEDNTLTGSNGYGVVFTAGDDEEAPVAPEVGVKLNVSGTEKIFPAYTAKIGDLSYATLADAVAAANAGDEIVMLAPAVVAAGETLELNKAVTITYTSNVSGEDMITNRGNLVIDGATLVYTNTDTTASNVTVSTISSEPGSTLVVNSGLVKNDSANNSAKGIYAYAIDLLTNGGLGDVTATINGGEIISTNYMGIRQFVNGESCKNILNVNGGTIKGATRGINIQLKNNMACTTITGGVIEGGDYSLCFLTTSENLSVTGGEFVGPVWYSGTDGFISGGTFDERFDDAYCAEGYVTVKNSDGTFGVKIGEYTVQNTVTGFGYETLADALAAVQNGDNTIVLLKDNAENVIVKQTEGVNIVIDGDNHTYSGTITIHGNARYNGDETLTIQNVDFVTNKADHYFIDSNSTASAERYAHNVTVKDSYFTATGAGRNTAAAMRIRQGFDISIENVTASNMHSLFQGYGCTGLSVKDVTVSGKNGISAGTSTNVVIDNATITATGYGIRADGSGAYDMTVKNSTIKAADPIVVRKNTADGYKLTVEGNNTLSGNANGYQVIFTVGDDSTYEAPTHTAVLSGTDNLNVFPAYQAKIGNVYYPTLAAAIAAAEATDVVIVLGDIELAEPVTVASGKTVTIDLNGKAITGTDNTSKNFGLFQNNGNLTINDSVGSGKIVVNATINSGWNRYSAVISNNPGGTLVVNGGTIEHLGGTDMAYGIDSLTNGGIGDVSVTINGGHVKSTYRGIRQFLNSDTKQNVLIINGGTVEGTNNGVFFHDPSTKANNGTITIGENAKVSGVYLFVTEGSTEWPVEVSIAKAAVTGEVTYKNVPTGYEVVEKNGIIGVESGVAKIGDTFYNTLQAAIDAAQDGDVVNLLANSSEDVTVVQSPDKDITIDGNGNTYSGTITIHGNARHDGAETLTIQNVKFETSEAGHYFIDSNSTGSVERYAHNVTVKESSFTATGAAEHTAAAMRIRQGFNISIQNVEATGMHSMLQAYGNAGVTISGLNATNMKNGISAGTSTDVVIDNVKIEASGYGVRADGSGAYDLTVKNSTINAELPVVIRKNTASGYELTMEGNTLSGNGYQVIFTAGDDEEAPVAPTVETVLNGTESLNVFPAYQAKIGNVYYPTLAAAIAAAEDGKTVTMLTDVAMDLTIDKAINLDTNGNTFTGAIVLTNADATVIGPETMNVTTNIADHKVIYDGSKHMIDAKDYVAEVNGVKYEKLSAAIAAASAGAKVTLIGNVEENVTVSKNLTIEGADFNYTGTMSISDNKKVTIQNVNFVKGRIDEAKGSRGTLTIKNCDFDGVDNSVVYAITMRGGDNVVIESCTVKNYLYGMLYVPNAVTAVSVKHVTVENCPSYAVYFGSGVNSATFEDVTIKNSANGFILNNTANRQFTIKNCKMENVGTAITEANGTNAITCTVLGNENDFGTATMSQYAKLVLAEQGATLAAVEGLNVVTNLGEDYKVVYENGTYKVVGKVYVAEVNGVKYEKLSEAIAAASSGDTVTLLADVTENVTVNKNLTIDGNGNSYTGMMSVSKKLIVTVQNVNFVKGCIDMAKDAHGTLNVKNCKFDGTGNDYYYAITMRSGDKVVVEGCESSGYEYGFLYIPNALTSVSVKDVKVSDCSMAMNFAYGTTIKLDNVTMNNVQYGIQTHNNAAKTITMTNCDISSSEYAIYVWERKANSVMDTFVFQGTGNKLVGDVVMNGHGILKLADMDATLTAVEGLNVTTDVADSVVVYENGVYSVKELPDVAQINGVGYKSIQAAIDAAVDGDTITIVADHALSSTPVIESTFDYTTLVLIEGKSVTIDFAGHTVTAVTGSADLYTAGIADTLISVIFAGKGASLTLKDSVGNGGIYVKHNADGGKVYSMIYNSASNLVIENGTYTVEETITAGSLIYADLTHTTAVKGGQYTLGNASADASSTKPWIINTEGKNKSFVEVTGGTFNQDILMNYGTAKDCEVQIPRTLALKNNGDGTWSIENAVCYDTYTGFGYETLAEAIAVTDNITLVADVAEDAELTKSITLDVNGCTYSGTVTLPSTDVTLTAAEGLNVITNIADHKVVYAEGVYKVVAKVYVAQVNCKKFESVQEAVNAATDGSTVTIIEDHEIPSDVNPLITISGKEITIDLNGKKITTNAVSAQPVTRIVFKTEADAKLTMIDSVGTGSVTANGEGVLHYMFRNEGELIVKSGSYELSALNGGAMFFSTNSNMLVEGGNFKQTTTGWMFNTDGNGTHVITVTGGTFNRYFIGGEAYGENKWGEVVIPSIYTLTDNGDGTWTIGDAACYNADTETGYASLTEAVAAAKTGETIVLLADNAENIELTKSITLDLNRMYMTGEITLASADAQLTSAKDLNVITTIADAEVVYENGIYMVKMFEYVAQIGETKYDDLSDALAIAQSGETVKVIANTTESLVMVPAGVTLDLNGHVVTADNVLSFGVVMDTASEVGGIAISNDTTKAFVKLQPSNDGYLPIYDTKDARGDMYKFFKHSVVAHDFKASGTNSAKFRFRILFDNIEGYKVLANNVDSIDFVLTMAWTDMDIYEIRYHVDPVDIVDYATNAYNQLLSQNKNTKVMYINIGGVNALGTGSYIRVQPIVETATEVVGSGESLTYNIP